MRVDGTYRRSRGERVKMRGQLKASVLALWGAASGCTSADAVERCGAGTLCLVDAATEGGGMVADAARPLDGSSTACSGYYPFTDQGYAYGGGGTAGAALYSGLYERTGGGKAVRRCTSPLPECQSAGVDQSDLGAAFANRDVVAAFAEASSSPTNLAVLVEAGTSFEAAVKNELLFGIDSSATGGALFTIVNGRDKIFKVGSACFGAAQCREIPRGIATLITLLKQLDHEQGLSGPCAGFLDEWSDTGLSLDSGMMETRVDGAAR